jgi:hypothetical protein
MRTSPSVRTTASSASDTQFVNASPIPTEKTISSVYEGGASSDTARAINDREWLRLYAELCRRALRFLAWVGSEQTRDAARPMRLTFVACAFRGDLSD